MDEKVRKIQKLKKEKNAVIMAHYYVKPEVQEIADYIGDSYFLSDQATKIEADTLVLCGVSFMGESAKILNPKKRILLPDESADCPMAHMASVEEIQRVRKEHPEAAVVCYVNSTAEMKTYSDVCVTSSNAVKIVKALPNPVIYFIPDEHLGHYVAKQVPEKKFIFNQGCCPIHADITAESVQEAKRRHPRAEVLVHPECLAEVTVLADYAGSTSGILAYAKKSQADEFIICTESGIMHQLTKANPDKTFYTANDHQVCEGMKRITLDKIIAVLESGEKGVEMEEKFMTDAHAPMKRMLELSK